MTEPLEVVFCGTPSFAVPTLERLAEAGFAVRLVVTQPDRPRGRGMEVTFSPVKQKALALGLAVAQPAKIKDNDEFQDRLGEIRPGAIVVVGYGRIIPPWMIKLPRLGNINLHGSLLPKYRGAAPIQWAIANGEERSGVTTMRIDAGLDTGDILLQEEVGIRPEDTAETLGPRMAKVGAALVARTLKGLEEGRVSPRPQDHAQATLAPILKKEDGRIDFLRSAREIFNRLRGFQPWPGSFTTFRDKNLHVWEARPAAGTFGEGLLAIETGQLFVGCGESTALELLQLQPEGKKRMAAADFIHGYRPTRGERLGS